MTRERPDPDPATTRERRQRGSRRRPGRRAQPGRRIDSRGVEEWRGDDHRRDRQRTGRRRRAGTTLTHEHILILDPEALQNCGHAYGGRYWDEDVRVADAVTALTAVREAGIRTLVDATAPGLGRYIPRIQRVNEAVDLNIIVATGLYAFLQLPNFLTYRTDEAIAALFVRELTEGIDDTGVKAAFIKCAVERHGAGRRRAADPGGGGDGPSRDRRAGHGPH